MDEKTCRHCQDGKPCRPRGLCVPCFYTPEIRDKYPIISKYAPKKYQFPDNPERRVEVPVLPVGKRMSRAKIADLFGISGERVKQIEELACEKLYYALLTDIQVRDLAYAFGILPEPSTKVSHGEE